MSRLVVCAHCGHFYCAGPMLHDAADCPAQLRADLAHERDRARRVVRVFWRVRDAYSGYTFSFTDRKRAFENLKLNRGVGNVYRVTVRKKKKVKL